MLALVLLPALFGSTESGMGSCGRPSAGRRSRSSGSWRSRRSSASRRDPAPARLHRAHAIPGAVHADRAGHRPGDRRRLGADLQRLHGARRLPGGNGRWPIRVQPSGGIRSAADARRVRRALLRVGRDAAGSGGPVASPDPGCRRADRRHGREASGRAAHRLGHGLSTEGRPHRRDRVCRRSASSRSSWPTLGRELGVLPAAATNVIVAAAIVSIVLNPVLYRAIGPVERWIGAKPSWRRLLDRAPRLGTDASHGMNRPADPDHRAVVIGYGPTGRAVVDLLRDNRIEPTVIDFSMDNIRALRERGIEAVYGDATRPEALAAAGVATLGEPHPRVGGNGECDRSHSRGPRDESEGARPGQSFLLAGSPGPQGRRRRRRVLGRGGSGAGVRRGHSRGAWRDAGADRARAGAGARGIRISR